MPQLWSGTLRMNTTDRSGKAHLEQNLDSLKQVGTLGWKKKKTPRIRFPFEFEFQFTIRDSMHVAQTISYTRLKLFEHKIGTFDKYRECCAKKYAVDHVLQRCPD